MEGHELNIHYMGKLKFFSKGEKRYAPVIATPERPRPLRRKFKRAAEAETYGAKVAGRLLRSIRAMEKEPVEELVEHA